MILVTLGTQDKSFVRLLKALDQFLADGLIQDSVIVQGGFTEYITDRFTIKPYFSQLELDGLRSQADLIITHAGVGSILDGLKAHKRVIGVARLKQYDEHVNDHQLEILHTFAKEGYIMKADTLEELPKLIREASDFSPKPYPFDNHAILAAVKDYIDTH